MAAGGAADAALVQKLELSSCHIAATLTLSPAAVQSRAVKFESFFGPGIRVMLTQTEGGVDVALISDGSAAGGIAEDQEVLPPLMPGLAPRVVKKTK